MVMQAYSKLEKQDNILYEKPTEYTMKDRGNTIYCDNCHHTVEFWNNNKKTLCQWCGKYVFKTKKDEFNYRMKERLKK